MSAMNAGIKWSREKICWIFFGGIPFLVTLMFIFRSDLAAIMDNWMLSLIFLIMPWISIVIVDYFIIRKQRVNMKSLYFKTDDQDDYGDWNRSGILSLVVGYAVGALFAVTTMFTGPIAKAMGGIDICWIVQLVVTSVLYYTLANKRISAIYASAPPYIPEEIDVSAQNI
jgi:NCS1 family nucleobase:cation symporter-1